MTRVTRKVARGWGRFGITFRLMVIHALVLTAVIGVIVLQSDRVITQRLEAGLNKNLADDGSEFATAAANRPASQSLFAFTESYLRAHGQNSKYLLVTGLPAASAGSGTPILDNPHSAQIAHTPQVQRWVSHPPRQLQFVTLSVGTSSFRLAATPLLIGGRPEGTLISAANLATLNPDRADQLTLAIFEGLAALIAAEIVALLLLRRVLRTVNHVTAAADDARTGNLSQRIDYRGPNDEVGRLARTMDEMLGQLDSSFTAQRRLLADVSHQLRTPITIARGHLEVLTRTAAQTEAEQHEAVALVLDELTQLSLMVERLLFLGQALEPDFLIEDLVDLPPLIDELYDAARVMANREWSLGQVPDVQVLADGAKLRGAILNLIDNAVKATNVDDSVSLDVSLGADLVIEVADSGKGISADDQAVIFDRFRRSPTSSYGGSGLGLAIVKAVAEAHGGRVELKSRLGEGTRIRIVLPISRVVRHRQLSLAASEQ